MFWCSSGPVFNQSTLGRKGGLRYRLIEFFFPKERRLVKEKTALNQQKNWNSNGGRSD